MIVNRKGYIDLREVFIWVIAIATGIFVAPGGVYVPLAHASGHENQPVRIIVTIEQVEETGTDDRCFDPLGFGLCDTPEFYAVVAIDVELMQGR